MKDNDDINTSLYNHFHTSLSEKNKLYHKYQLTKMMMSKQDLP